MKSFRPLLLALVLLTLATPVMRAQYADSCTFKPTQLIAPGILLLSGTAIHFAAHDSWDFAVRDKMQQWSGGVDNVNFDDYLQYVPYVMDLGLGLVGVKAEKGALDRFLEMTLGGVCCVTAAQLSKHLIPTTRPNGGDKSFPSGHTMTVFFAAELVRMEYGWGWGSAAYLMAGTVGFMRMWRNWHWSSDVLAGAGLGILSAHAGEWLLQPVKNLLHIPDLRWGDGSRTSLRTELTAYVEPVSGVFCTGLALQF